MLSGTEDSWQKLLSAFTMDDPCITTSIAELLPCAGTTNLASPVTLLKESSCSIISPFSSYNTRTVVDAGGISGAGAIA